MSHNQFTPQEAIALLDIDYDDLTLCMVSGCYLTGESLSFTAENLIECAVILRYKACGYPLDSHPILEWLKAGNYSSDLFFTKIGIVDGIAIAINNNLTEFGKLILERGKGDPHGVRVQIVEEIGDVITPILLRGRELEIYNFGERIEGTALEESTKGYFQPKLALAA